jgi:hemolysin activation/secretion protein
LPLSASGLTLELGASKNNALPGDSLREIDLQTNSSGVSAALAYPLIRSRAENLSLRGSFEVRNSIVDALDTTFSNDRIRALRLSANYNNSDAFDGQNNLGLTFSQGLNILGARKSGSLNLSRSNGRSDFSKLEANISRLQNLYKQFSLYTAVNGQYAFSQLLSGEQYGYGGSAIGRGYDSSEFLAENGAGGTIELRYDSYETIPDANLEPFIFYDVGFVRAIDRNATPTASGASAGLGLRLAHTSGINASVYGAKPLTTPASKPNRSNGNAVDFSFELSYGFDL